MTRLVGRMTLDEAIAEALKRDTLLGAQVYICIWEAERIVEQARKNPTWDTMFARILHDVTKAWNDRQGMETEPARKDLQHPDAGPRGDRYPFGDPQ